MKRFLFFFGNLTAVALLSLGLAGCPMQASYKSTITPIYAATNAGLWIFNGTSWSQHTTSGGLASDTVNSVVIAGSGSGAEVYVGTAGGVSFTNNNASSWTNWNGGGPSGLGSSPVNKLFLGSNISAGTSNGVSTLNGNNTWSNNTAVGSVNDLFANGTYTFNATTTGLFAYHGTSLIRNFTTADGLPNNSPLAVVGYSASSIYVGTTTGLYILNGGSFSAYANIPSTPVRGLFVDTYGYLFVATDNGLYVYGYSTPLFSGTAALCVWVDGAGTIYAGTSTGLRISRNSGASWTTELSGQRVNAVQTTAPLYSF